MSYHEELDGIRKLIGKRMRELMKRDPELQELQRKEAEIIRRLLGE